jgi:hypothetical protein
MKIRRQAKKYSNSNFIFACCENNPFWRDEFDRRGLIHQTQRVNCSEEGLDKSSPYNFPLRTLWQN